jgi:peptidoglycan/xylan/chitin deacetylase (PgdA/CDA1 family)
MSSEKKQNGLFVISLDFELFWGIRDKFSFDQYGPNVLGVWEVIPRMLDLFAKYDVHATFATVGAMFSGDLDELNQFLPDKKPSYTDQNLSPYKGYIADSIHNNPHYYFGKKLIEMVKSDSRHEIGTHTFSHYYGLEEGQTKEEFESDLIAAKRIAEANGIQLKSFVFPRHQINPDYLDLFPKHGIEIYRETEKAWFHSPSRGADEGILKRAIRYLDYFLCVGDNHCQDLAEVRDGDLYRIRASRWLRPYKESEAKFDVFKIRRIKKQMRFAAKKGKIFHLWFHPHDIGLNQEINFKILEEILQYYVLLKNKYGMKACNMSEVVEFYKERYER